MHNQSVTALVRALTIILAGFAISVGSPSPVLADESVFVENLKAPEHESLLYVWTRDIDLQHSDFLAVLDVDPKSSSYGKIITTSPTRSTGNEAHHFGYTSDAGRIFAGGLFSNQFFIYDVKTDPRHPQLVRTVDLDSTGYTGPHTFYAVPDGVLIAMLGSKDGGPPGGLVKFDREGHFLKAIPAASHEGYPIYMYDVGIKPKMNRMITSSWAHPSISRKGPCRREQLGQAVEVWDFEQKKIVQVEELDKAPLEVRWLHGPNGLGGFINCAGGDSVWYWEDRDQDGKLEFSRVIKLPQGSVPADLRISYDNRYLWVTLFAGNAIHQYDITNPHAPKFISKIELPQPNMMKLTKDSRRLYVSNSLLSNLDGDVHFGVWLLKAGPAGMKVDQDFHASFDALPTGPGGPHDMLLK